MLHTYRAGFLFSGMGALAYGVLNAQARLGEDLARFTFAGAVDVNPLACKTFEYLTGYKAHVGDVSALTYEDMRRIFGEEVVDAFFLSPPCKGFSQLLPTAAAALEHYQRLNRLVLQGVELMGAWGGDRNWRRLPGILSIENVQGIQSRGEKLLLDVKTLLHRWGYVFHEKVHDLGELSPDPNAEHGGPAHRPRYLLVARHPKKVPAFIHNPIRKKPGPCGPALFELPLPDDPDAGPLHRSPRSGLITLARLAAIPKGQDWRALPKAPGADEKQWEKKRKPKSLEFEHSKRGGSMLVMDPDEAALTVRGISKVDNGPGAVADSRRVQLLAPTHSRKNRHKGHYGVGDPNQPMITVTGREGVWEGAAAIADERMALLSPTKGHGVYSDKHRVHDPAQPARTVTSATRPGSGGAAFADGRMEKLLARQTGSGPNLLGVLDPSEPALTVTANLSVSGGNGKAAVADSRESALQAPRGCRNGFLGVLDPSKTAVTVTASLDPYSGTAAVADARGGGDFRRGAFGRIILTFDEALTLLEKDWKIPKGELTPLIVSPHDGWWHRALTKYDLWRLQGLPLMVRGKVPELEGTEGDQRELIGDAVPVPAAQCLGACVGAAMLAATLGTWALSSTGYWVRKDGYVQEDFYAWNELAA